MRKVKITYWVLTIILCIPMLISGISCLLLNEKSIEEMSHLGYPVYFIFTLGIAKIAGVITLLLSKFNKLKEWAYAGFSFILIFGMISHFASKDDFSETLPSIIFLIILFSSYFYYNKYKNKFL